MTDRSLRIVVGHRGARCLSGAHRSPVAAAYAAFMSDSKPFSRTTADVVLTALRRTRQVRGFTEELVSDNDLQTILEVARWSAGSRNRQPWTFIVVRERGDLQRLAELAPNAKHVERRLRTTSDDILTAIAGGFRLTHRPGRGVADVRRRSASVATGTLPFSVGGASGSKQAAGKQCRLVSLQPRSPLPEAQSRHHRPIQSGPSRPRRFLSAWSFGAG